jgi:hypothetical protein
MFFSSSTMRTVAMRASESIAGQLQREAAAPALLAVEEDAAPVRLDDVPDDRQAEPRRARLAAVGALHEALEDALAGRGRNAGTRVRDAQSNDAVMREPIISTLRPARCIGGRWRSGSTAPSELRRVSGDMELGRIDRRRDRDAALARLECEYPSATIHHFVEVHLPAIERDRGRARARDVQKACGHVLEPGDVFTRRSEHARLVVGGNRLAAQQIHRHAQRRERCPQLVRQRRHELFPSSLVVAQVCDVLERQHESGVRVARARSGVGRRT